MAEDLVKLLDKVYMNETLRDMIKKELSFRIQEQADYGWEDQGDKPKCPTCNLELRESRWGGIPRFCSDCGQKIKP